MKTGKSGLGINRWGPPVPCIVAFFAFRLNEFSTGICVMILAIERYILTCHPFDAKIYLRKRNRVLMYLGASVFIVVCCTVFLVNHKLDGQSFYAKAACVNIRSKFIRRFSFWARISVCFVIPAVISAGLYIRTVIILLKSKQNRERNRTLIKAFCTRDQRCIEKLFEVKISKIYQ